MSLPVLVMVIEDHDILREATVQYLQEQGFAAVGVACAEDVDDTPVPRVPDLYVIDLNLPGENGLSLAQRLRQAQPAAGIVIATARTQLSDRVMGYEIGSDIYLTKPVNPEELLATLRMLARKQQRDGPESQLILDKEKLLLTSPSGSCRLAESEARLLVALSAAKDQTLERWQVAAQLNAGDADISEASLRNRISQLRRKIQASGVDGEVIKAIRGSGYRLCMSLIAL